LGVYSIMLPDEKLIKTTQGFNRLVIIGCEGCANESLAYEKNVPQKAIFDWHQKQYRPASEAIIEEANRLKEVLKKLSNDIQVVTGMGLCSRSTSDKTDEWIKVCSGTQAVLALSCIAGILGIKQSLGKNVKVIPGMKTIGVLYSYREFDPVKGLIYIDKEKSVFVNFSKEKIE
jgi:hypothetical protein